MFAHYRLHVGEPRLEQRRPRAVVVLLEQGRRLDGPVGLGRRGELGVVAHG